MVAPLMVIAGVDPAVRGPLARCQQVAGPAPNRSQRRVQHAPGGRPARHTPREPSLTIYMALITIFRYGVNRHRDRAPRRANEAARRAFYVTVFVTRCDAVYRDSPMPTVGSAWRVTGLEVASGLVSVDVASERPGRRRLDPA